MTTAQDAYDSMLREGIRPRLRAAGFRGSGSTFTWPSEIAIAHVGLQRSAFSDRASLKFTANVTVVEVAEWESLRKEHPNYPTKPAPNTFYGDRLWQRRIGELTPEKEDLWWWVQAGQDWSSAADEFVRVIETHVIPELRQRA